MVYQLDDKTYEIINQEVCRHKPLVALLTGSGATGETTSRSDIDVIFVTQNDNIVSYRYYMPELTPATVRTEVGRIPINYLERVLTRGYDEEISTGLKEQLRKAKVLLGDKELGERIISGFQNLKPKRILLGNYVHEARQSFERLKQSLKRNDPLETMISIDTLGANCWRIILVAKHHVGVQKTKHEIRAARSLFDNEMLKAYLASRKVSGLGRADAKEAILAAHNLLSKLFSGFKISDRLIDVAEIKNE